MKNIFFSILIFLFFTYHIEAQFNAVSYDFAGSASVLQTNPGSDFKYKKLFGIPLLSNMQLFTGSSGFTLYDLFAPEGSFTDKVYATVADLDNTDYILTNYRQDLFSIGWTDDLQRFKYLGMYWEFDQIIYTPKDLLQLGLDGNAPHIFETYQAKYIAGKAEFIQTMYYGIYKKPTPVLSVGYRFKLYSGIANAQTVGNEGTFYTTEGENNFYIHYLNNLDVNFQSSGYNEDEDTAGYYISKFLFSGNYGPGFDFGLTYQYSDKMSISASLLDLGFVYYTKDINNYHVVGDYTYEGVDIQFPNTYYDYWKELKDSFNENVYGEENSDNYISFRPTTLYTSLKYGMGDLTHQDCENFMNPKNEYTSFVGLTGFAQLRPVKVHLGISAFYEQKWSKRFYTKLNLTADNFSYTALGGGVVWNIGNLQLMITADNLLGLSDLAKSKKQSFQFGLNMIKF